VWAAVASSQPFSRTPKKPPILDASAWLPWIANRHAHLDLNHGPIAKYFQHLAHDGTPKSWGILVKADEVADALGLDDTLLDSLLGHLRLE
jgi:hypothetical protein